MASGLLEKAAVAARREGAETVTTELLEGEPAEVILRLAEARGVDLMVIGNKGMDQRRRFSPGSVPGAVARSASTDLLIVDTRDASDPDARAQGLYRRLVVGTDGSSTAGEAARRTMELALLLRADVTLVYVGDPLIGAIVLEETANAGPVGIGIDRRLESGEPAERITGVAGEAGADLVVVGNKGMNRRVLGSVPREVAHTAPTDVLIVKTVDRTVAEIQPGSGAVVEVDGRRVAVFRDEGGKLHGVSPRCTHMGCSVDWNGAERTWDCPCHGSRYDTEGEVVRGPARKALAPEPVSEKR
jgi:nucleotide-binding universal stress UspA family protein/nitrite reductase/ring-hydroxylating ferredoxin subunit